MMWSKKWYYYLLIFMKKNYDIHPVDFIIELVKEIELENSPISDLHKEFMNDYLDAECFESEQSLFKYWSKDKNFDRLKSGEYGKLNMLYTYKIVLGLRKEFSECLIKLVKKLKIKMKIKDETFVEKCEEILKFQNCKFIQFTSSNLLKHDFDEAFTFDILSWIDDGYKVLSKPESKEKYNFYFTKNEQDALETQLNSNKSSNLNSKLRDMTVYTSTKMFFYNVERK